MLSVQTELKNYPANLEEFLWNPPLDLLYGVLFNFFALF